MTKIEHIDVASQVILIRGNIYNADLLLAAELYNLPQIVYLNGAEVVRQDKCRYES